MKRGLRKCLFATGVIFAMILACSVGTAIGKGIYKSRYFAALPAYESIATTQRADRCPLCNHYETNPPCLIDLNTGKVAEIRLYDAHETIPNQISEKTDYGRAVGGIAANVASYFSFPDNHYSSISIQKDNLYTYSDEAARQFFCDSCMDIIEERVCGQSCGQNGAPCFCGVRRLASYGGCNLTYNRGEVNGFLLVIRSKNESQETMIAGRLRNGKDLNHPHFVGLKGKG